MKKAIAYYRYSSDRQNEQSIEGQMRCCHEFAEREDITIVSEYVDRAVSATSDHRPQFQKMINDCKTLDIDYVIVYKLDRFARNRYDSCIYKAKLKQRGIRLLSAMEKITDSPEGIIMEGILEAMNEYYSAELSQKIRRGIRENVIKGKHLGGVVCLGYKIGPDHVLVVDENEAKIVRLIFSLYQNGKTLSEITDELNKSGYKTAKGNPFGKNAVGKLLHNERYTGHFKVKGMAEEGVCPVIIEQSVFDEVNAKLEKSRQKNRHKKRHEFILSGLLYCGECGKRMTGVSGKGHLGKVYNYYKCGCHTVKAENLENASLEAIEEYLHSDCMKSIAKIAFKEYQEQIADTSELVCVKKELLDVEKKLNNAIDAVLAGLNSPSVAAKISELEERKKILITKKAELSTRAPELTEEMFITAVKCLADEPSDMLFKTIVKRIELNGDYITVYFRLFDIDNEPPEKISAKLRHLSTKEKGSCKGASGPLLETIHEPPSSTLYEHGYIIITIPLLKLSR